MRRVGLLWLIVVCCVLLLAAVGVAGSRADIRRVSVSALGRQANADSTFPSISGGGRYFAFASSASNLVRGDTNHAVDIFVRDRVKGTTRRVSVTFNGHQANGRSAAPVISPSGTEVVFASQATNLVPGFSDPNGSEFNLYVRDLVHHTIRLVSVGSVGAFYFGPIGVAMPDDFSPNWSLSAQGRFVVFTDGDSVLRERDLTQPGATPLGSQLIVGGEPSVSGDAKSIVFVTNQSLSALDTQPDTPDAYLYTPGAAVSPMTLISVNNLGLSVGDVDRSTAISADGRYIVYSRFIENPHISNCCDQLFLFDVAAHGVTHELTKAPSGAQANGNNRNPSISDHGRYVVFSSGATNLIAGIRRRHTEIYVRDTQLHRTRLISRTPSGSLANQSSTFPVISYNGAYAAFQASATNLVPSDTNRARDIFRVQLLP